MRLLTTSVLAVEEVGLKKLCNICRMLMDAPRTGLLLTKVLHIKPHSTLLTKQFLAACHLAEHPGGKHLGRPPEIRGHLKPTLLDHETEVWECFPDLPANESSYKNSLKSLHTSAVLETLQSYDPNRVLQLPPPEISSSAEEKLPRKVRCELFRLRSGFSRNLMSFMSTIDNTVENKCPLCEVFPHDTNHLFTCTGNLTQLTVEGLWTEQIEAARFLFDDNDDED